MRTTLNVCFIALILALIIISLEASEPTHALTKPATPTFTIKYIDNSYDIPPSYTTDPYTGGNVSTNGSGEHIDDRYVVFTIKNQPFTAYTDAAGNSIKLYYNFRFKGHDGVDWVYYPFNGNMTTHSYGPYSGGSFKYYPASTEDTTIFSIKLSTLTAHHSGLNIPEGSTVDFEIQAQVGYIDAIHSGMLAGDFYNFTGQSSEWSSTQTVRIGETPTSVPTFTPSVTNGASQPSITPAPQGTQTNLPISINWEILTFVGLVVAVVVLAVGLLVVWRRLSAIKGSTNI